MTNGTLELDLAEVLRRDLADVATRFVDLVVQRLLPGEGQGLPTPEQTREIAELVSTLRPEAAAAVQAVFAQAMEREVTSTFDRILTTFSERGGQ